MSAPAIEVLNLVKQYGSVLAVDGISFTVAPGELVGFLGLNGAGKTTTMRILTTFMPASSGTAKVVGYDVMYQSDEVRSNLGYLPENVPLYPEMRVEEYLLFRAKLKKIDREGRTKRIDYCLERCRIKEVRRRLLSTLSKGYRQRVGLADAMLSDPKVLILDEPLTGLDPIQQEETLNTIRSLGGEHTVLFSSHHLPDVEKVCERAIVIHRGKIGFNDTLSSVQAKAPRYLVEVRGDQEKLTAFFKGYPGVEAVEHKATRDDQVHDYELKTHEGRDIREAMTKTIVEQGFGLRRLEQRRERLEDTFSRVIFDRDI